MVVDTTEILHNICNALVLVYKKITVESEIWVVITLSEIQVLYLPRFMVTQKFDWHIAV